MTTKKPVGWAKEPTRHRTAYYKGKQRKGERVDVFHWNEEVYTWNGRPIPNKVVRNLKGVDDANGFDPEDIKAIKRLRVGETWKESTPLGVGLQITRAK